MDILMILVGDVLDVEFEGIVMLGIILLELINNMFGVINFVWDFGDGNMSIVLVFFYIYIVDGIYQVILIVFNVCGVDIVVQFFIVVILLVVVIDFEMSSGCLLFIVNLVSVVLVNVEELFWIVLGVVLEIVTGVMLAFIYIEVGIYIIYLEVSNVVGVSIDFMIIEVKGLLDLVFLVEVDGFIVNLINIFIFVLNFNWVFGDGNSSEVVNFIYIYVFFGDYDIILIVVNECGQVDMILLISIVLLLFIVGFEVESMSGCVLFEVVFVNIL